MVVPFQRKAWVDALAAVRATPVTRPASLIPLPELTVPPRVPSSGMVMPFQRKAGEGAIACGVGADR